MKGEYINKLLLIVIALLLLMNFTQGLFSSDTAVAEENMKVGRYQISSWAAQTATGYHHTGYYIVDTVSGKVVETKSETHTAKE